MLCQLIVLIFDSYLRSEQGATQSLRMATREMRNPMKLRLIMVDVAAGLRFHCELEPFNIKDPITLSVSLKCD